MQSTIGINVCVLAGSIHRAPEWRQLPSGDSVTTFDLKVLVEDGRPEIMRVSWMDAPTSALDFNEGDAVVVTGRMRSYWASRIVMDMSASSVVPARSVAKVRRSIAGAMAVLQEACP